jgi:jumonji domain-containing protein 2
VLTYGNDRLLNDTGLVNSLFQVDFEDSSQLILKRESIYSLDEDMPKKVKGRLVGINYYSNRPFVRVV